MKGEGGAGQWHKIPPEILTTIVTISLVKNCRGKLLQLFTSLHHHFIILEPSVVADVPGSQISTNPLTLFAKGIHFPRLKRALKVPQSKAAAAIGAQRIQLVPVGDDKCFIAS